MAVAILPAPPSGGFGLVKSAAGRGIRRMSGFAPAAPLSGQRALSAECLRACRPLAPGFGDGTAELSVGLMASKIGARSYVALGARVVDRVVVGEGALVAAGAVVTSDVERHTQVVGVPARVTRTGVTGR